MAAALAAALPDALADALANALAASAGAPPDPPAADHAADEPIDDPVTDAVEETPDPDPGPFPSGRLTAAAPESFYSSWTSETALQPFELLEYLLLRASMAGGKLCSTSKVCLMGISDAADLRGSAVRHKEALWPILAGVYNMVTGSNTTAFQHRAFYLKVSRVDNAQTLAKGSRRWTLQPSLQLAAKAAMGDTLRDALQTLVLEEKCCAATGRLGGGREMTLRALGPVSELVQNLEALVSRAASPQQPPSLFDKIKTQLSVPNDALPLYFNGEGHTVKDDWNFHWDSDPIRGQYVRCSQKITLVSLSTVVVTVPEISMLPVITVATRDVTDLVTRDWLPHDLRGKMTSVFQLLELLGEISLAVPCSMLRDSVYGQRIADYRTRHAAASEDDGSDRLGGVIMQSEHIKNPGQDVHRSHECCGLVHSNRPSSVCSSCSRLGRNVSAWGSKQAGRAAPSDPKLMTRPELQAKLEVSVGLFRWNLVSSGISSYFESFH